MEDPFDVSVIDHLNEILHARCPSLTFFYETPRITSGKYGRKIGFHYNKTGHTIEVSYIELGENLLNEVDIMYSSTVDDMETSFNKRKLNTCLRLLAGMIASKEGVGLKSVAVNPISLYTMVKYFDCTIQKKHGVNDDVAQCSTLQKCITFMGQTTPENEEHDFLSGEVTVSIKTAVPNYDDMLEKLRTVIQEINCVGLGGRKKRTRKLKIRATKYIHNG